MTSFAGLTNAAAALAAQSYGMQIAGQNIANADTDGYTRERVDLAATGAAGGVATMYAKPSPTAGTVNVTGVARLNDLIVDAHARAEHAQDSYLATKSGTLSSVEANFDEPSDNGLTEQLNTFWNDWSSVANNPGDGAARSALLAQANTVTSTLNNLSDEFSSLAADTSTALNQSVTQLNTAASSVARLNGQIAAEQAAGSSTANLQDQRDLVLAQLASLGGATASLQTDGSMTVTMGGQTLVAGNVATAVGVDGSNNITIGGSPVTLTGGQAKAQSEALITTLPAFQSSLDGVASALASSVNSVHSTGYDLTGTAGGAFFTGTSAATIGVAITNPNQVAASGTASAGGNLDAGVATQIANLGASSTGADAAYRSLVANVGSASQQASQQSTVQQTLTANADAMQASASGVSTDDEVTSLLTYQRAYQAAARVLTTIDDALDTLINHTGRVGL